MKYYYFRIFNPITKEHMEGMPHTDFNRVMRKAQSIVNRMGDVCLITIYRCKASESKKIEASFIQYPEVFANE